MKNPGNQLLKIFILTIMCCYYQQAQAQFIIDENFRGSPGPEIITGDQAYFTSGIDDPINAGWLRLTTDDGSQKGYTYINRSFPSTLGLLIEFEYKMWRNNDGIGADGFTVFLFDANYGPGNFALGAYGGSLGYANNADTPGITGGYVGIGFDAFGNFVRNSEEKNGGSSDLSPNSVALRGPTTNNSLTTNEYLAGVTILNNDDIEDAINMKGNGDHDVLDYNTSTTTRPSDALFYRRVQIEIVTNSSGTYDIIVRWRKSPTGSFVDVMTHTLEEIPPTLLKMGFAASTGGEVNFHEIRSLMVTTPGNLRVAKRADKDILRSVDGGNDENQITYSINVVNDTDGVLTNVYFEDKLTDANGTLIPSSIFNITNISHNGFSSGTTLPSSSSDNEFSGTLSIDANSTGTITVTGTLNGVPTGNVLNNTATALPTTISDTDLQNNESTVSTPVISEEADLVLSQTVDQACVDPIIGNAFTLTVSNMGSSPIDYVNSLPIKVTKIIPEGTTISNINSVGWDHSVNGNEHTFETNQNGTLQSGRSLSSINFTLKSSNGYTSTATVGSTIEDPEFGNNNSVSTIITNQPSPPEVVSPIYYMQGESAGMLTATSDSGNELIWYLNEGAAPSSIAFIPETSELTSTIYYVRQQAPGGCISDFAEIEVIILEKPSPGSITGGGEVCVNSTPTIIANEVGGTGAGSISYRWEYSKDNGTNWEDVVGEIGATLQPSVFQTDTHFRRITLTEFSGQIFESIPSNVITFTTKNCMVITNPMIPSKPK